MPFSVLRWCYYRSIPPSYTPPWLQMTLDGMTPTIEWIDWLVHIQRKARLAPELAVDDVHRIAGNQHAAVRYVQRQVPSRWPAIHDLHRPGAIAPCTVVHGHGARR